MGLRSPAACHLSLGHIRREPPPFYASWLPWPNRLTPSETVRTAIARGGRAPAWGVGSARQAHPGPRRVRGLVRVMSRVFVTSPL
jgi:mono/diheme cytochrome c family protein